MQAELKRRSHISDLPIAATDVAGDVPDLTTGIAFDSAGAPIPEVTSITDTAAVPAVRLPRADFCRVATVADSWPRLVQIAALPAALAAEDKLKKVIIQRCGCNAEDIKAVSVTVPSANAGKGEPAPPPYAFVTFGRADTCDTVVRELDGAALEEGAPACLVTFVAPCKAAKKVTPELGVSVPDRSKATAGFGPGYAGQGPGWGSRAGQRGGAPPGRGRGGGSNASGAGRAGGDMASRGGGYYGSPTRPVIPNRGGYRGGSAVAPGARGQTADYSAGHGLRGSRAALSTASASCLWLSIFSAICLAVSCRCLHPHVPAVKMCMIRTQGRPRSCEWQARSCEHTPP
jgi:hypothetical protein